MRKLFIPKSISREFLEFGNLLQFQWRDIGMTEESFFEPKFSNKAKCVEVVNVMFDGKFYPVPKQWIIYV